MCGITGYIGSKNPVEFLYRGLKNLEYRGYDSAGIALGTTTPDNLTVIKAVGKLVNLEKKLISVATSTGFSRGIGHIRWATHGKATLGNAHPHTALNGRLAIVHNGIIENNKDLKQKLLTKGYVFSSETDTEVIAHLIADSLQNGLPLRQAVRQAVNQLQGAYALGIISADNPDKLIATRSRAPLIIGSAKHGNFIASDIPALLGSADATLNLNDGELAELSATDIKIYDSEDRLITRPLSPLTLSPEAVSKQGRRHFMLKEIHEQGSITRRRLQQCLPTPESPVRLDGLNITPEQLNNITKIEIIACGTSLHAAEVGQYVIEELTGINVSITPASEYICRRPLTNVQTLVIGVSQSGETADTISAIRKAKERRARILIMTNRPDSSITAHADDLITLDAGIEVSVAATKSYTAQLLAFYLLALYLAENRHDADHKRLHALKQELLQIPGQIEKILSDDTSVQACAKEFQHSQNFIYMSRGVNVATAREGALKLKEISYINAGAYPAGELKHGPIALLDEHLPVVSILMPGSANYAKLLSNSEEAKARHAPLIAVTSSRDTELSKLFTRVINVPEVSELLSPLTTGIPLQLLAYYIAADLGRDVDQPRNLAKSVTVE